MRLNSLKWIILALAIIVGAKLGVAQSYFHSPNDTLSASTVLDGQVTMSITQVHSTNDTLQFFWNKLSVQMPIEWEANICDNSNCYPTLENSGAGLPVLPGDDGLMLLHCTPHVVEGTAIIRYTIYEMNTPSQVDTLTWIIQVTSAGLEAYSKPPNIIWSYDKTLFLEGNAHTCQNMKLYDEMGQLIFESPIDNQKSFKLPLISSSMLFIELSDENNIYKQKIFFQ